MVNKPIKIFYSWQSWTPGNYNQEFIESALQEALNQITANGGRPIVIDRDTKGLPGAPAIADTILEKISSCDIFLGDVTFVMQNDKKITPNPNVMLELGYAVGCLSWNRIILVMNKSLGEPDRLPFDLRHRLWPIHYELASDDQLEQERNRLIGGLKDRIETILHSGLPLPDETAAQMAERFIERGERPSLDRLLKAQISQVHEATRSQDFFDRRTQLAVSNPGNAHQWWHGAFELYYNECHTALDVLLSVCWYGDPTYSREVANVIGWWKQPKEGDPQPGNGGRLMPSLYLMYLAGIVAVATNNWQHLNSALLSDPTRRYPEYPLEGSYETIWDGLIGPYQRDSIGVPRGGPIGRPLQELLRPLFIRVEPNDQKFYEWFDTFEFLVALHHFHLNTERRRGGLFLRYGDYHREQKRSIDTILIFLEDGGKQGDSWGPLAAGLFGGSSQTLLSVLEEYQKRVIMADRPNDFAYGVPDYVAAYRRGVGRA